MQTESKVEQIALLLAECLLTQREEMSEPSIACFNLQLANVLTKLKQRVDTAAASIEGLDVYVGRALRTLNGRAEKMERHFDGYITRMPSLPLPPYYVDVHLVVLEGDHMESGTTVTKAVESEAAARDDAATKNIVHAAIVMANLCQYLAGIALQQSIVVVSNPVR
ncbi:hypothetical protein COOONC_19914 [Cooperia oncophora]